MNQYMEKRNEKGFTLIELLIAIVVVGILTAVAIVGIAGLTDKGSGSACSATLDAVRAAEAVHYANTPGNVYPSHFSEMLGSTTKELVLTGGAQPNGQDEIDGNGWVLKVTGGGGANELGITAYKGDGSTLLTTCK